MSGFLLSFQHIVTDLLFLGFSSLLIISALLVITLQNPVKSVLSLVVCFFAAAGLWLLLTAEFLALILILVYVGAVMTLFLFVVMTLNIDLNKSRHIYLPAGILISALLTALLIVALNHSTLPMINNIDLLSVANNFNSNSNTAILGKVLYTQYLLSFEIAGVILLTAMISAISLILMVPETPHKKQNIDQQIKAVKQNRVRLVK